MSQPICPDCNEKMIKAYEQNEEGDWGVRWLCGCKIKVKKSLCPECEEMRDCKVVSETPEEEALDCLWCGMDFEITRYAYLENRK